ncbi:MAG: histidine phosphatase family protein [Herbaspirillum sp.]|jgi:phosphohistidine phosphatase|nr:histidine phosphatase family protein [Herbaspirillum sp.]
MDLILWRHAEAEIGEPDEGRALTGKGQKQAWKIADWLDRNLPNTCRILVSPATRTVQTAEALGRKFKIHPDLGPGATPEQVLAAAHWPDSKEAVLIVGHQPALGQIASMLMGMEKKEWTLRKANVWWFAQRERNDVTSAYLRAVIAPELLVK